MKEREKRKKKNKNKKKKNRVLFNDVYSFPKEHDVIPNKFD